MITMTLMAEEKIRELMQEEKEKKAAAKQFVPQEA